MANEKDLRKSFEITSGEGDAAKTVTITQWNFLVAIRNLKEVGKALTKCKEHAPDLLEGKIMKNINVLLEHAPDHVEKLLFASLPLPDKDKNTFLSNMSIEQGIDFIKAVVVLNFLDEKIQAKLIESLKPEEDDKPKE